MEQERKIEKWLKAYAKKRRGQAGDPFTLDPATRRILQNEISRSAPASEDEDETMSLWELLRKHWLYLLGFAACVFVVAALLLPTMYAPKSRSLQGMEPTLSMTKHTRQSSASIQRPIGGAPGSDTAGRPAAAPAVAPPQVFSQNVVGGIETTNSNVATLTPPSPPPAALSDQSFAPTPAPEPIDGQAASPEVSPSGAVQPTLGAPGAIPDSGKAGSAPSILPRTGIPATASDNNYAMNSTPNNSLQTKTPPGQPSRNFGGGGGFHGRKDYVETMASPSQSAAVLMNFQVSQNGKTIRVVDQDGSVYTGALELEEPGQNVTTAGPAALSNLETQNMAAQNTTQAKSQSPKMAQFDTLGDNAKKADNSSPSPENITSGASAPTAGSQTTAEPQAPMQKYFFYAVGTNQTLKQSVVFAGTLLENLSVAGDTQQTFGMSANAALGAAYAQQFVRSAMTNQPLRIEGIAIIDQTYKIQINAAPVRLKSSLPLKVQK